MSLATISRDQFNLVLDGMAEQAAQARQLAGTSEQARARQQNKTTGATFSIYFSQLFFVGENMRTGSTLISTKTQFILRNYPQNRLVH